MSVKSQQVSKPAMVKRDQAKPGVRNRVRGFPGNHTMMRALNPVEEMERQTDKQGAHSAGVPLDGRKPEIEGEGKHLVRKHSTMEDEVLVRAEGGVRGAGLPLPAGPRDLLEAQFGSRFGDVRLHTGPPAAGAARQLGAAAYTLGRDIAFADGFYAPHTGRGLRLLSHEVAHVVQSQNAPAGPLRAGEAKAAIAPLEQDAERAVGNLGRGRPVIQERLNQRMPLCHPVYLSAHGDQKFMDAAAAFYADWGNATVKRGMNSIEDLVKELAGQGAIDHITIVSHANPNYILMQFINGGPNQVMKTDWDVDTPAGLVNLERHLADAKTVDTIIQDVQTGSPGLLSKIGSVSDPVVRQFIWWIVDQDYVARAGFGAEEPTMLQTAKDHTTVYRNQLLTAQGQPAGAGSSGGSGSQSAGVTNAALNAVEQAVLKEAGRWKWPAPEAGKQFVYKQRLGESPSADIVRITQKPDFFNDLAAVRKNVSGSSWIEIQGCNAGADRDYLVGAQKFFGGAAKPKVTAPDWFQVFGNYGFTPVTTKEEMKKKKAAKVKTDETDVEAQWKTPGVPEALAYWYPVITGKNLPKKPSHVTLQKYLEGGNALPLARPGAIGDAMLLVWSKTGEKAFLAWLSRHSYQITKKEEIKKRLFASKVLKDNTNAIKVDWLQKSYSMGATEIVFRPQKEYDQHIIKVP